VGKLTINTFISTGPYSCQFNSHSNLDKLLINLKNSPGNKNIKMDVLIDNTFVRNAWP